MGDRCRQRSGQSGSIRRRKSFFRRIADSISSFVPTTFFTSTNIESREEGESGASVVNQAITKQISSVDKRSVRDSDTQTHTVVKGPANVDVDLDAGEISEGEISAHSSTSGVSSLVPRSCAKPFGFKSSDFSVPTGDPAGRFIGQSNSAACSDAIDSTASSSTFRASSITPWILSHGYKRADSPSSFRPTKKQKVSCSQSLHSSCDSERMSLFYRARTTYGGASSCRSTTGRNGLFEPTTPLRFELEVSRQAPFNGESATTTNLSSTARRILESLERFTTPLSTADRVPLPLGGLSEVKSTPFPIRKTFRCHRFPSYMQAYRRLKINQDAKRDSSNSSYQQNTSSLPPPLPLTAPHVAPLLSTTAPVVSTSSTPILATSSVKGFDFQSLPLLRKETSTKPTLMTSIVDSSTHSPFVSSADDNSINYTFAPPLKRPLSVATELVKLSTLPAPTKFTFSSPLRSSRSSGALQTCLPNLSVAENTSSTGNVASCSPIFTLITSSEDRASLAATKEPKAALPTFDQSKSWRCEACLLENPQTKQTCSVCALPRIKPNALSSTSINTSTSTCSTTASSVPVLVPASVAPTVPTRWECPACMIFNENTQLKCKDCGALPGHSTNKTSKSAIKTLSIPETSHKWECPTCMVFNDADKSVCACCQTSKPDKTSQTASRWECPTCMVFNTSDKVTCPCCSTSKPTVSVGNITNAPVPSNTIQSKSVCSTLCTSSIGSCFPFTFGLTSSNAAVSSDPTTTTIASVVTSNNVGAPFTPVLKNTAPITPSTITLSSPNSFQMSSGLGSAKTTVSPNPPLSTNPTVFQFGAPNSSMFTFGLKRPLATETISTQPGLTVPPVFTFGLNSNPKLPNSLSNGLPNGETNVPDTPSVSVATTASAALSKFGSGGFTFTTTSLQPALAFGSSKSTSLLNATNAQPAFTFGLPLNQTSGIPSSSTANLSANSSVSSITPFSKTTAPFVFGPTQNTAAVFSFGSGNQVSKAPISFGEPTNSLPFGQSATPNLFSANSTAIAARKKVHATRRLHR